MKDILCRVIFMHRKKAKRTLRIRKKQGKKRRKKEKAEVRSENRDKERERERSGWWLVAGMGSGTHPRMTDGIFAYHDRG